MCFSSCETHPRTHKSWLGWSQMIYRATGATERIIQSRDGKTTEFPEEIKKFHSIMLAIADEVRPDIASQVDTPSEHGDQVDNMVTKLSG
jgi:hypothetical protein